jgi:hypothetical protein
VLSAGTGGRHGLHVRLVVIGHHLIRDYPAPLDRLAKERLSARRVAVVTLQDVDDYARLVDRSVHVA